MNANPTPTVDAHQHFWDLDQFEYPWMTPDLAVLRRNYLPAELSPQIRRVGIDRTVFVQAQMNPAESDWVLSMTAEHPWIAGVVGWLDLTADDLDEQLSRRREHPKFVGVRHPVHDESDERWLLRDDVVRGLQTLARHDMPYDLLLRPPHLKHIPELVRRVPNLRMVIDHLAKPLIARGELEPWRSDLAEIARLPQIHCKVSGMITEADQAEWRAADLLPYVEKVVELFGPERLMFGSDWPVCRLAGEYSEVVASARYALSMLTANEQAAVFGRNAVSFYRLPTP
ncbi:MAG: amidohydrolase family protein [Planctomycetales bacterium]|nr:amidohydrolase family protein [Planctomycetales bacterium]